jgi:hypothetical protein
MTEKINRLCEQFDEKYAEHRAAITEAERIEAEIEEIKYEPATNLTANERRVRLTRQYNEAEANYRRIKTELDLLEEQLNKEPGE